MLDSLWRNTELPQEGETPCWEIYHENSKTGHYDASLSNEQVAEIMTNLYDTFPYRNFQSIQLPETFSPVKRTFLEAVLDRSTPANITPVKLTLEDLRTLLHCSYGVTRNDQQEHLNRAFRTIPSGGALYPLELYFYTSRVDELESGLYHYNPTQNAIQLLRPGNFEASLSEIFVSFQSNLAYDTSLIVFITAVFNRSTFKYKEKGYRFALFEAGHLAQNLNLAATALDFGVINIGGYHDRLADRFLGLDGLNHSTIYINGICKR